MLSSTCGLDHQLQAFHAQDGYAVTSREEHCRDETLCHFSSFSHIFETSHAWWAALTQKLFLLLQRKTVEHLPEEPDGGMVRPVLPFVFSTLKGGDKSQNLNYLAQKKLFFWFTLQVPNELVKLHISMNRYLKRPSGAPSSHSWCCQ